MVSYLRRAPLKVVFLDDEPKTAHLQSSSNPNSSATPSAQAVLLQEANIGLDTTTQILATTIQSTQVANETASSLVAQTNQLENIHDDLDEIEVVVGYAERNIENLIRNPLRTLVEKPFKRRIKPAKLSKLTPSERNSLSFDHTNHVEDATSRAGWLKRQRNQLFVGRSRKSHPHSESDIKQHTQQTDSYSNLYSDDVNQILRKQDQNLDETVKQLNELSAIALGMNEELEKQAEIVDSIDAPLITRKIRFNNNRLKQKFNIKN